MSNNYPSSRQKRTTRIDWLGYRNGRILVVQKLGRDAFSNQLWLCECSCGNNIIFTTSMLNRPKKYRSCGCWRLELSRSRKGVKRPDSSLGRGIASRNKLLSNYKKQAAKRNYSWNISDAEAIGLFQGDCFYCGAIPAQRFEHRTCDGAYIYNGIDRTDNSLGYEPGNIVSCCGRCNIAKNDTPHDEFVAWIERVHSHLQQPI